ncbi:cathepsin H [Pycnococcus provasolii]
MARALVFIAVTTFVVAVKAARPLDVVNSVHTLAVEGASELEEKFQAWAEKHNVNFQSNDERSERLDVYKSNAELVARHNRAYLDGKTTWAMTLDGAYAATSSEEFEQTRLMMPQNCSATHVGTVPKTLPEDTLKLPDEVDWRTKGVVTPVKNQGSCGSCWTFSTTGTLEAHHCIKHKQDCTAWTGLAEQQLVDCAGAFDNHGCDGGLPSHAFEYIRWNGGLDTEESYTYTAKDGKCEFKGSSVGSHVTEVHNITAFDEDAIGVALAKSGPVAVAYQVASDFRLYSHGVYDSYDSKTGTTVCKSGPTDVNHAVVAVGYGTTDDDKKTPYFIVRNSWSKEWGMEGYFWIKRGENLCGIADCASFPDAASL